MSDPFPDLARVYLSFGNSTNSGKVTTTNGHTLRDITYLFNADSQYFARQVFDGDIPVDQSSLEWRKRNDSYIYSFALSSRPYTVYLDVGMNF